MSACPICLGWMLDMNTMPGWKKCQSCAYCHDQNRQNKLTLNMEIHVQGNPMQSKGEGDDPDQSKDAQDRSKKES